MEKIEDYPGPMKGLVYEPVDRIDNKGKKVKATKLPKHVIIMPKLNGIRMRWDNNQDSFMTNNGNKVKSCDHIVEEIKGLSLNSVPLDGEAYVHDSRYAFRIINGFARRSYSNEDTRVLQYHVFDLAEYNYGVTKLKRLQNLERYFSKLAPSAFIHRVPWVLEKADYSKIEAYFKRCLADGYEGIMICDPESPYTEGKGKWMWKWKPVYDAEFKFLGFNHVSEGRNVDLFASLILGMDNGKVFGCSGISDEDKRELLRNPPPVGTMITVEYGAIEEGGAPIFPRYKGVRWDQ